MIFKTKLSQQHLHGLKRKQQSKNYKHNLMSDKDICFMSCNPCCQEALVKSLKLRMSQTFLGAPTSTKQSSSAKPNLSLNDDAQQSSNGRGLVARFSMRSMRSSSNQAYQCLLLVPECQAQLRQITLQRFANFQMIR